VFYLCVRNAKQFRSRPTSSRPHDRTGKYAQGCISLCLVTAIQMFGAADKRRATGLPITWRCQSWETLSP